MPISTLHRIDKILFPSAVSISCFGNQRISAGIESMIERPAGHVWPMFRANQKHAPVVEASTPSLATFLTLCGVGGVSLAATSLFLKKATVTGSVARATTQHQKLTVNSSLLHWTQVRLPHNGKGEAQFTMLANYDGTNDPIVYAGSQALSGNLTATEFFGCGPVLLNGVEIPGIQDITIDSGIQIVREGAASEEFDTFIGIETGEPSITIQTREAVNWSTIGLRGTALDGSNGLQFYARKYAANGSRVADATAEHIGFQGLIGAAIPMDTNGESNSPITDTIKFELVAGSDSVLPLLITVGVALP